MSFTSFSPITIVSVNGLADARGSAMALQVSLEQMPGAQALLCSPQRPDNLPSWIAHHPIAPLNYHEYSWFMMMVLWRFVQTDFALIVQDDGWSSMPATGKMSFSTTIIWVLQCIWPALTAPRERVGQGASAGSRS